uniref:Malectin-like domain-containing protein n=1 Tax=Arundo donax TaxID=35708 RepID=A0A0A8Y5D2_ARUDO
MELSESSFRFQCQTRCSTTFRFLVFYSCRLLVLPKIPASFGQFTQFCSLANNRYPFDPHDRLWQSYGDIDAWTNITTSTAVDVSNISNFDTTSKILWSSATPVNGTRIDFTWSSDSSINNDNASYLLLLYFAEVQRLPRNALRRFDILIDNATWNGSQRYTPKYLSAELVKRMVQGSREHTVSLVATSDATLPPILNAFEIYSVLPMTEFATNDADGICFDTLNCSK